MIYIVGFIILALIIMGLLSGGNEKNNRTAKNNSMASGTYDRDDDDSLSGWIKRFSLCFRIGIFTSIVGGITLAIAGGAADNLADASIRSETAVSAVQIGVLIGVGLLIVASICFTLSFLRWLFSILF